VLSSDSHSIELNPRKSRGNKGKTRREKRGYMVCTSDYNATNTAKKKMGYRVCLSGHAATDTSYKRMLDKHGATCHFSLL
jgi:hypothetical protein